MPVAGGAGGLDARPMEPVFSFASLVSQASVVWYCEIFSWGLFGIFLVGLS